MEFCGHGKALVRDPEVDPRSCLLYDTKLVDRSLTDTDPFFAYERRDAENNQHGFNQWPIRTYDDIIRQQHNPDAIYLGLSAYDNPNNPAAVNRRLALGEYVETYKPFLARPFGSPSIHNEDPRLTYTRNMMMLRDMDYVPTEVLLEILQVHASRGYSSYVNQVRDEELQQDRQLSKRLKMINNEEQVFADRMRDRRASRTRFPHLGGSVVVLDKPEPLVTKGHRRHAKAMKRVKVAIERPKHLSANSFHSK